MGRRAAVVIRHKFAAEFQCAENPPTKKYEYSHFFLLRENYINNNFHFILWLKSGV